MHTKYLTLIAFITSLLLVPLSLFGQRDCFYFPVLKVSRVEGRVFDPRGVPVPGASVVLLQDKKPVATMTTDNAGWFRVEAPVGLYWLRVDSTGFAPSIALVRVRHGLLRPVQTRSVYLILGLGMVLPCPAGTLSKKEFQSTVKSLDEMMK